MDEDTNVSSNTGDSTEEIPSTTSEGTVDSNSNEASEKSQYAPDKPEEEKEVAPIEKPIEDQEAIQRKIKYATIEAENAKYKFKEKVSELNSNPQLRAQEEQKWLENPKEYESFRQQHIKIFGEDLGEIDQYFEKVTTNVNDPKVIQVKERKNEMKVEEAVDRKLAERELDEKLFEQFPDANPRLAKTETERQARIKRLALAKLWGVDRVKEGLSESLDDAVIDTYAYLSPKSESNNDIKTQETRKRFEQNNANIGISPVSKGSGGGSSGGSYNMTEFEREHYNNMIRKGKTEAAELFAKQCTEEK